MNARVDKYIWLTGVIENLLKSLTKEEFISLNEKTQRKVLNLTQYCAEIEDTVNYCRKFKDYYAEKT